MHFEIPQTKTSPLLELIRNSIWEGSAVHRYVFQYSYLYIISLLNLPRQNRHCLHLLHLVVHKLHIYYACVIATLPPCWKVKSWKMPLKVSMWKMSTNSQEMHTRNAYKKGTYIRVCADSIELGLNAPLHHLLSFLCARREGGGGGGTVFAITMATSLPSNKPTTAQTHHQPVDREGDPEGWSSVIVTALGSWGTWPPGTAFPKTLPSAVTSTVDHPRPGILLFSRVDTKHKNIQSIDSRTICPTR
jgi:hypothetical protein